VSATTTFILICWLGVAAGVAGTTWVIVTAFQNDAKVRLAKEAETKAAADKAAEAEHERLLSAAKRIENAGWICQCDEIVDWEINCLSKEQKEAVFALHDTGVPMRDAVEKIEPFAIFPGHCGDITAHLQGHKDRRVAYDAAVKLRTTHALTAFIDQWGPTAKYDVRHSSSDSYEPSYSRNYENHLWYGDHHELDWRDRETAQMYGMDADTYASNYLND
jgi:hypothetical protein